MRSLCLILPILALLLSACGQAPGGGNGGGDALQIQASPAYLAFPGTRSTTLELRADGSWTTSTDQAWLTVSPAHGSGNATVTITVDRSGLAPDHHAGSVLFKSASAREVVTVYMRFPSVRGSLTDPNDQITTSGLEPATVDPLRLPHAPGEVLVRLDRHMAALATSPAAAEPAAGAVSPARAYPAADASSPAGAYAAAAAPSTAVAPAAAAATLLTGSALAQAAATLHPQAMRTAAAHLASDYHLGAVQPLAPGGSVFLMRTSEDLGATLDRLARDGRVAHAEPNYVLTPHRVPNDPHYARQWHYASINLPAAWDLTTGSADVVVGVIDTAIDTTHPDLAGRLTAGYDFITNTTAILSPAADHGTHVAGTIAAASDNGQGVAGVNWSARVMPLNVIDTTGNASFVDIYRAIVFAAGLCVDNSAGTQVCNPEPVDVINMSLGPTNSACSAMPTDSILEEAIAFALGQGVTLVASAGNDDCPVVGVPAALDGVIAVSATNIADVQASYSNSGQEIWVAAPGGDTGDLVYSTVAGGGYGSMAGTSMASPHVAGVAALVKATNPDLTPTQVAFVLADTATDLGLSGPDTFYGYGLVDAAAAVQRARELLTTHASDLVVRLRSGTTVVRQVQAGATGAFVLENVAAGIYTLEAGNDANKNGVLGDPGEFYGSRILTVAYTGDTTGSTVAVTPR